MITRSNVARLAIVAGLGLSLAGCDQYAMLKARKSFKEGNGLYQAQEYERAAEAYEATLSDPAALEVAAELTVAYFYLGNSYDNLYRPSQRGEAENDAFLDKAIENYEHSVASNPRDSNAHYNLALAVSKRGEHDRAISHYRLALELAPDLVSAQTGLGDLLESVGRYDESAAHWNSVLARRPQSKRARQKLSAIEALRATGQ